MFHHGKTDLEGDTAGTAKEWNSKISNMKKNSWVQDQEKHLDQEKHHDQEQGHYSE